MSKPKVAIYKMSSCAGCQLEFLNLEPVLLDLLGLVDLSYFVMARREMGPGPYDVTAREYREYVKEKQVPHSNALHSYIQGRGSFMVGPVPRLNLNLDNLGDTARKAMLSTGVSFPTWNPFHGAVARAVELVQAIDDSIRLIDRIDWEATDDRSFVVSRGQGYALTEAPRGTLYHSYRLDRDGNAEFADIVTPTAHNLNNIEKDLRRLVPQLLGEADEEMTLKCEMAVRNYDPCISCSAHFLRLRLRRL